MSQNTVVSAKIKLSFLMIGKTGHGKGATGNSILGRKEFVSSSSCKSVTKEVNVGCSAHGVYDVTVVDSPGLQDTDLKEADGMQKTFNNMEKTLSMCNGGVHVFLLVIKFGTRFTREERRQFGDLKSCCGINYLKNHGIIVVTGGDQFLSVMEEEGTPSRSFKECLQEQNLDLFKEYNHRIVLFNNVTRNEEAIQNQRNKLFQLAEKICLNNGLYTNEFFQMYDDLREDILTQNYLQFWKENVKRQVSLFITELDCIAGKATLEDLDSLQKHKDDLYKNITNESQTDKTLQQLIDVLWQIQRIMDKFKEALTEENHTDIQLHLQRIRSLRRPLKKTRECLRKEKETSINQHWTDSSSVTAHAASRMWKSLRSVGKDYLGHTGEGGEKKLTDWNSETPEKE